jgi:hypothetical protein
MEMIKKNVVSIVLGVVAVLAVAAIFYPLGGLFDGIKKNVLAEEQKYTQANQIYTAPHELPLSDDPNSTERPPLGVFPMPRITRIVKDAKEGLDKDSDGVLSAAVLANQTECTVHPEGTTDAARLLLVPGSLPSPASGSSADAEFKKALDPEIAQLRKVLDAVSPPTAEDIDAQKKVVQAQYDAKKFRGADGQVINEAQINAAFADEVLKLPLRMRDDLALNHHMYMDLTAIVPPAEITGSPQPPSPPSMYYAQAAIWMQEDICRAIAEVNADAHDVLHAPVKRLVSLTVPPGALMFLRPPAENAAGGGAPGEIAGVGGPTSAAPRAYYSITPTGRTCNGMFDVVTALVVVHVDAAHIPQLLTALNHNRFLTVRNMSVSRVDSNSLLDQGYVYGPGPIAELKLDCEQLQMREWTTKFMPPAIVTLLGADGKKDYFAQAPQPPVTGNAGAAPPAMNPTSPGMGGGINGFGGGGGPGAFHGRADR